MIEQESNPTEVKQLKLGKPDIEDNKTIESTLANVPTPSLSEIKESIGVEDIQPKKRGRKSKAELELLETENKSKAQELVETYKPLIKTTFDLIFQRLPNPQPITEIELRVFTESLTPVVAKYYSKLPNTMPEIMLGLTSLSLVLPRLKKVENDTSNNDIR
jgi:hypothetical protein